ncbi:MAG: protein kinase [Oscillospiraceae bacterium]|nr:protein kinase [Oscillospiraceae bacterium]
MLKISDKNLCECCFAEISEEPCSKCGYSPESYPNDPSVLPCGSALMGRYAVGRLIGMGGFGITYLAYDIKMGRRIAIKEFFPFGLAARSSDHLTVSVSINEESAAVFKNGAERFYEEARMVAGFNDNPNIVSVYDFFYENSTAYYTMEYLHGQSLKDHIVKNGVLSAEQAVFLARCVSDALMTVHEANVLHRDVSPDNIMLCENGKVKLIDFGAARQVIADRSQSMSVILKPGFAPLEQYQKKSKQGPWTDIYSFGTTLFYAMTGIIPDDPMTRLEDDDKFSENSYSIDDGLWNIVRKATMLKVKDRYGSVSELISDLEKLSVTPEPIIGKADARRNGNTVRTQTMTAAPSGYPSTASAAAPAEETVPEPNAAPANEKAPAKESAPAPVGKNAPAEESAPASEEHKAKKFPAAIVGIASAAAVIVLVICIAVFGKGGSDSDIADDIAVDNTTVSDTEKTSQKTTDTEKDDIFFISLPETEKTTTTTNAPFGAGSFESSSTSVPVVTAVPESSESETTAVSGTTESETSKVTMPSVTTPGTSSATKPSVTAPATKPSVTTPAVTITKEKVTAPPVTAPPVSKTTTTATTTAPKPSVKWKDASSSLHKVSFQVPDSYKKDPSINTDEYCLNYSNSDLEQLGVWYVEMIGSRIVFSYKDIPGMIDYIFKNMNFVNGTTGHNITSTEYVTIAGRNAWKCNYDQYINGKTYKYSLIFTDSKTDFGCYIFVTAYLDGSTEGRQIAEKYLDSLNITGKPQTTLEGFKSYRGNLGVSGTYADVGFIYPDENYFSCTLSGGNGSSLWVKDTYDRIDIFVNDLSMEEFAERLGESPKKITYVEYGETVFEYMESDSYGYCYKVKINGMYLTIEVGTESSMLIYVAENFILPTIYIYS